MKVGVQFLIVINHLFKTIHLCDVVMEVFLGFIFWPTRYALQVVGDDGPGYSREAEKDTDIAEVLPPTKMSTSTLPSGKVASLQKHFEAQKQTATLNSRKNTTIVGSMNCLRGASSTTGSPPARYPQNPPTDTQTLSRVNKDKYPSPTDSSGYDSSRSNKSIPACDLDVRLAQALEENDKMFRTFDTLNRNKKQLDSENGEESSVFSRIRNFNSNIESTSNQLLTSIPRQSSHPVSERNGGCETVPSPPPRLPVTNSPRVRSPVSPSHGTSYKQASPTKVHQNSPTRSNATPSPSSSFLSKSASHGDIAAHSTVGAKRQQSSNGSASSEDLRLARTSQGSPSKQNVLSSNDSLTSSSSLVTVKSASLKSLDDDPPELPPRNLNKTAAKPPLPRSASQVRSRCCSAIISLY